MATNPYFNFYYSKSEQNLLESLVTENIRGVGLNMLYLPRQLQKEDLILGEDVLSKFDVNYEVEFYIKTIDRFGGQGDFLAKFGMDIEDTFILQVSRPAFAQATNDSLPYPREGDLIFFPLKQVLMEIKHVEEEPTFYQLGKVFMYELRCELFRYGNEMIQTGDPEIDMTYLDNLAPTYQLFVGNGSGNFNTGEWLYQGNNFATSEAKAQVVSWDNLTKDLFVKFVAGEFKNGDVIGSDSAATYAFTSIDLKDNLAETRSINKVVQEQSVPVVNKTEKTPFGSY